MDEDDEIPCTSFFSKRAMLVPRKTAEELKAASELVERLQPNSSVISNIDAITPPCKKTQGKKGRKVTKKHLENEESIIDDIASVSLTASAKKRIQKFKEEQELELENIEAENERILTMDLNSNFATEAPEAVTEEFEKLVVLTITYMSDISRVKCYENDKFLTIFPKVAEIFNLKVSEFLLCLRDKNIVVDDTPKSLKITDRDILECIPYKIDESHKVDAEDQENIFRITFQSNDSKKKIDMPVHKAEKMLDIMEKYAKQRELPLEQLIFEFDGEKLTGNETPAELDMEPESCVDVTVVIPVKKSRPKSRKRKK